ncbi:MAG: zinc ribbon domain-containing protein [Candidatus Nanoarchaeia archaeon]
MNKADKNLLLTLGGLTLLGWLLSKKHGKCPRCNYPVTSNDKTCPNCGQWLNWEAFK